jgi:hypothetical protein
MWSSSDERVVVVVGHADDQESAISVREGCTRLRERVPGDLRLPLEKQRLSLLADPREDLSDVFKRQLRKRPGK